MAKRKMNREIKFRAWDKERKLLIGSSYPNNWNKMLDEYYDDAARLELTLIEEIVENKDYIVEQFTGLKDKNGKEIYEGDIIKFPNQKIGKVIFNLCEYVLLVKREGNYSLYSNRNQQEVIGNIHENPELLEKMKNE